MQLTTSVKRRSHSRPVLLLLAIGLSLYGREIAAANLGAAHPLDPLSKDEIVVAIEVLKNSGKITDVSRFPTIVLNEPPKEEVLKFKPGDRFRREAFAVVYERAARKTFEAVVDINNKNVVSWKEVLGVQPPVMPVDVGLLEKIVRADPQWQAAMRKRGVTDFEGVQVDPWPGGDFGFPEETGFRMLRGLSFYKGKSKNHLARPIEGVVAYVNLDERKVFKLIDTGVVPMASAPADFDAESIGKTREGPKPLRILQPGGVSYTVTGNEVRWQNWRFRFAMHPREGLVLYTVGYEDQGRLRSILYRASCSEMLVAYGDATPAGFFKIGFDEGECGLGWLSGSLEPTTDAPENAQFFDAVFATNKGVPYQVPRLVALYERDGGILWKHYDYVTNESRRARELVLSFIATVGKYEYSFNWVFHQDGALEMELLLTGKMQTKGVNMATLTGHGHEEVYGHLVADGVAAVHHQHYFGFRLDMDVDGTSNTVVEMNAEGLPKGPANPYGNAIVMRETTFRREQEAQRQLNLATGRKWSVINPSVKNGLGGFVGYMLVPGENAMPFAAPDSALRKRAAFINSHLWVTQYNQTEMNAAGYYVNQSKGGGGLPAWTSANRPIENKDLVLWYTLGTNHIPRPEEWPVMSSHHTGFKLIPNGFFIRNPALDVPKSAQAPVAKTQ